ncbi:MAG: hypothetical protein PVJ72_02830, partial [Gammaproteobacteria bacterium]
YILDISTPTTPIEAGYIDNISGDVAVSGNYAYVTNGLNGLVIVDITDLKALNVVGSISTRDNAVGVTINGNYAYIADLLGGLRVVDVSVPEAPVEVGVFYTPGITNAVAISGNYAYVADDGFGLGVYEFMAP